MASPAYRTAKPLPPLVAVQFLFSYDPEEGVLRWAIDRGGKAKAGTVAGSAAGSRGYRQICIGTGPQLYKAHRLVWLLMTGEDPAEKQIDHINGNKDDNRFCNLRLAGSSENKANTGKQANNTSGYVGVGWHKRVKRWQANLVLNQKHIHIGYFDSAEEAYEARKAAELQYHGEFAAHLGAERGQ